MDVTRSNFVEALAIVKKFLPTASFVSIDLEFTGLGESRPSQLDTPAMRYQTAREDSETFAPVQFGLSIFRHPPEAGQNGNGVSGSPAKATVAKSLVSSLASVPPSINGNASPPTIPQPDHCTKPKPWHVITFNFNIYPQSVYYPPTTRYPYYDRIVKLQSSSIQFLMEHGFDFTKLYTDGISWVREETEQNLRKHITSVLQRKRNPSQSAKIEMNAGDKKMVQFYREAIAEWLKELSKNDVSMTEPDAITKPVIKMFSMPKTPVQRRLVFDCVRDEYPRILASSFATQERTQLKLEVYPTADLAHEKREQTLRREVEEEVSKAVGFRYVIDALRESKLPLVVHNGIMDTAKLFANFVAPMPPNLNDFKQKLLEVFPLIYDTRWMMQQICDSQESVRKAIDADKARSMDEVIRTLRQIVARGEKGRLPDIRTFIPNASVAWHGKHISGAVLSWTDVGIEIHEDVTPCNVERDKYGFGRYAMSEEGNFGHEAGFDAMETGKLFIMLLYLRRLSGEFGEMDLASKELASSRNKIMLGSCGGYRYIDIITRDPDEDNIYFKDGNVVVISGEWNEGEGEVRNDHPYRRRRVLLKRVTAGTGFDAGRSSIIPVGPLTMLAVLKVSKGEDQSRKGKRGRAETINVTSEIQTVIENGKQIGVGVALYRDIVSSTPSETVRDLKKRRCA